MNFIGKTVLVPFSNRAGKSIKVEVKVLDLKNQYGVIRYKVTPVKGSGEVWVETIIDKVTGNKYVQEK